MEEIVRLNVGGIDYSTTKETLLREKNSIFATLFPINQQKYSDYIIQLDQQYFFIDRDGSLFAFVLEYLRSGKLVLPENFQNFTRLRDEAKFYRINSLKNQLDIHLARPHSRLSRDMTNIYESGGHITLGYRGTFAFGRDGQADVKFRKLQRILVCGKVSLCREIFGDTLNDSRDPDREGNERYTSRLYLKHQCLEKACDTLAEKGFKLIATCCSGANGLATTGFSMMQGQSPTTSQQDLMNQRNSGDLEEQRWAHYTEYIFYREPIYSFGINATNSSDYSNHSTL